MNEIIEIIKGIHPGFYLERELKKRQLPKGKFALSLNEYPQTLVAIMKGKRRINTALALKIEQNLGIEEGFFMILQVFYDIKMVKKLQHTAKPDIEKLRPVLFWDTKIETIDWEKYKKNVIIRTFERGNDLEKEEITRFYGENTVSEILKKGHEKITL